MKKLFTLSFLALLTVQISTAQDFFSFPEGTIVSTDGSEVTLPPATVGASYSEVFSFYVPDVINIPGTNYTFSLVSGKVDTMFKPTGMDYSCYPENCEFTANTTGEVTIFGTPDSAGTNNLNLIVELTVDGATLGHITFPIPYDGSNTILNLALDVSGAAPGDYSLINNFLPSFILNVNPIVAIEELNETSLSNLVVAPNPASTEAHFTFYNRDANDVDLQVFDLLGNLIHTEQIKAAAASVQTVNLNTSSFNNGVYIYKLTSAGNKLTGRLLVNK